MNMDAISLQDCLDMMEFKNQRVVIEDGHITAIVKEERNEE